MVLTTDVYRECMLNKDQLFMMCTVNISFSFMYDIIRVTRRMVPDVSMKGA